MISIIVPVYNVEKYLPQCLDSLISQTYRDIEIILVDDGSPDRCPEICDEYARMDGRIAVIHQPNAGVSAARNAGLGIAKGQYIGFVDPDDWASPEMFGSMLKSMRDAQADLAVCGYAYCREDGSADEKRPYPRKAPETMTQKEAMKRLSDLPPTVRHVVWNKLFHKNLLQGISFPEHLQASEDVWFLTEYLLRIHNAVVVHEPYYYNRVRDGSATHGGLNIHNLAESFAAHDFMYQSIVIVYPDLKKHSQAFLLDVYQLKYNDAKKKAKAAEVVSPTDAADLKRMRRALHAEGWRGLFNPEIYWKTRLAYLLA